MMMNTWDLSGALVRMGDNAAYYARKANQCNRKDFYDMKFVYDNTISGIQIACSCFTGFSIRADTDRNGYYKKVWIVYNGDIIGAPWFIEDRG